MPADSGIDFERLVPAAAHGDAEAYGELVNLTSALVSSIALAIVRDLELSRDVAQEVFLSVWRDLKSLRNPASFLPWLRQVARNRAKAAVRARSRRWRLGLPGVLEGLLPVLMDPGPTAADRMIADEESRAVADALSALPEETREVLTLFYREGQSVAQVSALLELSEPAVRKRLSRARGSLRAGLREQVGEALGRTRPDASFTAVVIAALPAASLPGAGAAALGASKISGGSLWLAALKLLAPFWGSVLGSVGAILGVLYGSKKWLRDARDEEERRGLRRLAWAASAAMLFFGAALPVALALTHDSRVAVPWFLGLLVTVAFTEHVARPRIVRRRMEAEMLQDPEWAAARRRKERRQAILGWTLGLICGMSALILGLWLRR